MATNQLQEAESPRAAPLSAKEMAILPNMALRAAQLWVRGLSAEEWRRFLDFMRVYAEEHDLSFESAEGVS